MFEMTNYNTDTFSVSTKNMLLFLFRLAQLSCYLIVLCNDGKMVALGNATHQLLQHP